MTTPDGRLFGTCFEETQVGASHAGSGRTITEADVVNFAMFSGDWYPLHVDTEYAATSVFGQRIAHGLLTLAAISGTMPLRPGELEAFYGIEELRFRSPVFIGDTLRTTFSVVDKSRKRTVGVVRVHLDVTNQRGETVVSCDWLCAQRYRDES